MSRARDRADGGLAGVTTGSGNVTITDGNLILDGGNGIDFSDQPSPAAGMTSELLDSYEEGTWSPVVADGSGNNMTMHVSFDTGFYTKIGNLVTVCAYPITTSLGSASGNLRVTGLPFTVVNDNAGYSGVGAGIGGGFNITIGESVSFYVAINSTYGHLRLWDQAGGTSYMQASEWTDDGSMIMNFSYRAA